MIPRTLPLLACVLACQASIASAQQPHEENLVVNPPASIAQILKALGLDQREQPGVVYLADATQPAADGQSAAEKPAESQYWLGIALAPVEGALKAHLNREHAGVLVMQVVPNSPAAQARLQEFDVIVQVNDQPIDVPTDLTAAVEKSAGKELVLLVVRAGQEQEIKATPGKRPAPTVTPAQQQNAIDGGIRWLMRPDQGGRQLGYFFHPGMVVPEPDLPKDMSVTFEKQGNQPARITVKQGDKSWTATEETLAELPADIMSHVERILRRPQGITLLRNLQPAPALPVPSALDPAVLEQLKQMNQQLERLQLQVEELKNRD